MNSLEKVILNLENKLLKSEIRKSSDEITEILDEEFFEFCSSGVEYHYKKGDVFQNEYDNRELNWVIKEFKTKELSHDCILATYVLIKNDEHDKNKKYSLRSSIWKCYCGKFKIIFHQGTLCNKDRRMNNYE